METPTALEQRGHPSPPRSLSFESVASRSAKYRADVDGLRAVAVIAVLLFHLGISTFRNGFMGVDVFYVISGYLITSLIAKELAVGSFSIITFYERRMRRIFPALFSVLFFCILAASVLLYPEELTRFGKSVLTTTFFVSNLYFWHTARPAGYFDATGSPPPLLHTWSLSVEEQFYLLFPLTLYLLFRWARKRIVAWLLFLSAVSFAFNLWTTQHKPVVAFYWLMPRAWELLLGALLAIKALPIIRKHLLREIVALLGIAMILIAVCIPLTGARFPGYIVLLPCVGTALVIHAGEGGPSIVSKTLSLRPVVFIGVISYSLYLWHWPAIVFTKHYPFHLSGNAEIAFVVPFSLAAAFLSFEYIERPFRGSASVFNRKQIFAFGLAASILAALFGLTAYRTRGLPERYDARTLQILLANQERMIDFVGTCENWKTQIRSMNDITFCKLGGPSSRRIMFWGDSHVEMLYPVIKDIFNGEDFRNREAMTAIAPACLPDEHINYISSDEYHCDSFARLAMQRAQAEDIDTVFLGFSTWWWSTTERAFCLAEDGRCAKKLAGDEVHRRFLADLSDEIRVLKAHGKRVIVCLPFPLFKDGIPELEMNNATFGRIGFLHTPRETDSVALHDEIKILALNAGAEIFDPRETLCKGNHCETEVNGVSIYSDNNHIASSQVSLLEDSLRTTLQRDLNEHSNQTPAPPDVAR